MARVGALRRLAQGLRSLGAVGELSSSSAAPASSLLDSLPSTSYSTAPGWQPSRRSAGGSTAAATAASGGTGSTGARSQHSGPATAAAAVPPPRRAVYRVEVVTVDDKLAAARRALNAAAARFNAARESFPAVLFAGILGFGAADFDRLAESEKGTVDQTPKVAF